jgi:hypothetical protein
MAWQRTALGAGGVGALLVHLAGGLTWGVVAGASGMVVALALIVASERRYERTGNRVLTGRPASGQAMVRALAGVALLLAVCALLVVSVGVG